MNLRPHHLLCIRKFTGHGYNADYTASMESIVSGLSENPDTCVTVTQGCDDICKMCPHNISGVCTSHDKVSVMDSNVLGICNITYGEEVLWAMIVDKVWEKIFKTGEFNNICACCEWFKLCRNTEVHER